MVDVTARHEHSFHAHLDEIAADCTGRWLKRVADGLAVLLFDLDDRQLLDRLLAGFVFAPLQLGFTLRDASDHFKYVIVRRKIGLEVVHELRRINAVRLLHLRELSIGENLSKHTTHHLVDLLRRVSSRPVLCDFDRYSGHSPVAMLSYRSGPMHDWLSLSVQMEPVAARVVISRFRLRPDPDSIFSLRPDCRFLFARLHAT